MFYILSFLFVTCIAFGLVQTIFFVDKMLVEPFNSGHLKLAFAGFASAAFISLFI